MSFISKITGKVQDVVPQKAEKLANRFVGNSGFMTCGATYHAPRTNTTEEIISSLKLIAQEQLSSAEKGRKNLLMMLDEQGLDFAEEARKSGQDVARLTIQKQNALTARLNDIIRKGGQLTKTQHEEFGKLTKLSNLASSILTSEFKTKEITEFLKVAGEMPQRHLSLAHDVVDLSNTNAMINHDIFPTVNFNVIGHPKNSTKETTLMGYILNLLPGISKANPKVVDLAETVVSHSDDTNAKFFLDKFVTEFPILGVEKQAEATEALVKPFAESILKGMPSMDLGPSSKEQTFFNIISNLCSPSSKPENLKLLKQTLDTTSDIAPNVANHIELDDIRLGDTEKIAENLKILPQVLEAAEANGLKELDVSGFLTKNVNLN